MFVEDRGGREACTGIYCYGTILLHSTLCSPALKSAATSSRLFSGENIKIELYYLLLYNVKKKCLLLLMSPRAGFLPVPQTEGRLSLVRLCDDPLDVRAAGAPVA